MCTDSLGFAENLQESAQFAFELANRSCGSCVDYHALRPYLRLAGMVSGPARHAAALRPYLRDLLVDEKDRRVLIAGAGDAGLLALLVRQASATVTEITVVDRCPTPLELCRRFAQNVPLSLETRQQNLEEIEDATRFDLVVCHLTLSFVSPARRPAVLENLRRALRTDGKLLLVYKSDRAIDKDIVDFEIAYSQRTLAELERLHVTLPQSRQELLVRLRRYAHTYYQRRSAPIDSAKLESALHTAGFEIIMHAEMGTRLSLLNETRTEYLVIAKRSRAL
jgi:SAM-dependent methyltransferase